MVSKLTPEPGLSNFSTLAIKVNLVGASSLKIAVLANDSSNELFNVDLNDCSYSFPRKPTCSSPFCSSLVATLTLIVLISALIFWVGWTGCNSLGVKFKAAGAEHPTKTALNKVINKSFSF